MGAHLPPRPGSRGAPVLACAGVCGRLRLRHDVERRGGTRWVCDPCRARDRVARTPRCRGCGEPARSGETVHAYALGRAPPWGYLCRRCLRWRLDRDAGFRAVYAGHRRTA